jgi:hypothetical protein
MKTLYFTHAGTDYACSIEPETLGHVTRYGEHTFKLPHPSWTILGFSSHHWHNRITIPLTPAVDVKRILHCFVWDSDHGTTRTWGGQYCGKLSRISSARVTTTKGGN